MKIYEDMQMKHIIYNMRTALLALCVAGTVSCRNYLDLTDPEALSDGKRSPFGMKSKITTMEDISIYTGDGETKLRVVFEKMRDALSSEAAPTSKASADELKEFFGKVLPDYDRDRFYVSHMKKVVDWYNILRQYASLDFIDPQEEQKEEKEADAEA